MVHLRGLTISRLLFDAIIFGHGARHPKVIFRTKIGNFTTYLRAKYSTGLYVSVVRGGKCIFLAYCITTRHKTTRRNRIVIIIIFFFPVALFYLFALLYYIVGPAIAPKGRRTVYVNAPVTTSCSPSKKVFRSIRSTPKEKQPSPPPHQTRPTDGKINDFACITTCATAAKSRRNI